MVADAIISASSDRGDAEDPGLAFDDPVTPDHVRKARGVDRDEPRAVDGPAVRRGSLCFLVGPFPGYVELVGPGADAVTFFVGSLLFTAGGAMQIWLATDAARRRRAGGVVGRDRPVRRHAVLQRRRPSGPCTRRCRNPSYDRLVWRPDAFGSICFLVSGVIAYRASRGAAGCPRAAARMVGTGGQPAGVRLLRDRGRRRLCRAREGSMLDLAAVNWNTSAGAACFLAMRAGHAAHRPHDQSRRGWRRIRALEQGVVREVERLVEVTARI